jgi:uncharacterized protein YkwD
MSVLLAGCVEAMPDDEAPWTGVSDAEHRPPPGDIDLEVTPLYTGGLYTATVTGTDPGARVYLAASMATGPGPCPGALLGACLDLTRPRLLGSAVASPDGVAVLEATLPDLAPGMELSLQAAAVADEGTVSAVVTAVVGAGCVDDAGLPADWVDEECRMLHLLNALRAAGADCGSEGLFGPAPPLVMHDALRVAARTHSAWMSDTGIFSHDSPGGPLGDDLVERIEGAGYGDWRTVGENISMGWSLGAEGAMDGLEDSDGHCRNMLSSSFEEVGIGYARADDGEVFFTQVFGARF